VSLLGKLTVPPAWQEAQDRTGEAGLKAIYFHALDYKVKPTKVLAWLGFPSNHLGTVPAVVLVHGGGGTAFKEWVRLWNAKSFAAISIPVEGQTDQRGPKRQVMRVSSDVIVG
jgi:cephalosporin-C deacetylase-like acetyl esterase